MHRRGDLPIEAGEILSQERDGKLPRPIRAKIEPNDDVTVPDALFVCIGEDDRLEELVAARLVGVGFRDCGRGSLIRLRATSQDDGIPSQLVAFPPLIAIHGIITTDHRGNMRACAASLSGDRGQVIGGAGGRSIAPVGDGVDHDVVDAGFLGRLRQGDEVILMAMHAAIRDETKKVQPVTPRLGKSLLQNLVRPELAIGDGLVDAGEILINDPTGPKIHMADFRVAHLPIREPNIQATGAQGRSWISGVEVIVKGRAREHRGITVFFSFFSPTWIDPPSIANYQNNRSLGHGQQIRLKFRDLRHKNDPCAKRSPL